MSNIVLITAGDDIAHYAELLKKKRSFSDELDIVNVYMEEAVDYARHRLPEDTDVIIARGNTARLLKNARLSVPVVTIPIRDSELVHSIEKARSLCPGDQTQIAYIGMEDVIRSVSAFLDMMNCQIRFYPASTSQDIEFTIKKAKKDRIAVVIGGIYTQKLAYEHGLECVLLESSLDSLQEAYERALEVQKGVQLQRKKLQERITMVNAITDGLVSINKKKLVTLYNPAAERYFNLPADMVIGKPCSRLLDKPELELLNQVLLTGKPLDDHLVTIHGSKYLLSIQPVMVQRQNRGVILSLHAYPVMYQAHRNPVVKKAPDHHITSFFQLTGTAPDFQLAISLGRKYAGTEVPVLLIGESGSGRETLARCIHSESVRKEELFLSRNGALLTPADFLSANNGTLYIRDIDQMSATMQEILADVLRSHTIQLADGQRTSLDLRILAGSARHLARELAGELYYLLNTLIIPVPPLRSRGTDITALFRHFLETDHACGKQTFIVADDAKDILTAYSWPGNISQLISLCKRLALLSGPENKLTAEMVRMQLDDNAYYAHLSDTTPSVLTGSGPGGIQLLTEHNGAGFIAGDRYITYQELQSLNQHFQGRKKLIAEYLGISRSTLWRHMKEMD